MTVSLLYGTLFMILFSRWVTSIKRWWVTLSERRRDTLKKITDLKQLRAFNMNGRRAYRLEDLDAYVESLPGWYDSTGEKSAKVVGDRGVS
jgi:hypothetical protein